jgi:hypothetical protein
LNGGIIDSRGANHAESFTEGQVWLSDFVGLDGGKNMGDPVTIINRFGKLYVLYMKDHGVSDYVKDAILGISYSNDNGATWNSKTLDDSGEINVGEDGKSWDKPHATIDTSPTSPYKDNIYAAFTFFHFSDFNPIEGHNNIFFTRLSHSGTDLVQTECKNISQELGDLNQGVNVQVGTQGQIFAVWSVYDGPANDGEDNYGFAKSLDGGNTFTNPIRIFSDGVVRGMRSDPINPAWNGLLPVRVNSYPVLTVVNAGIYAGRLIMVWTNRGQPGTNIGDELSVYCVYSDDEGNSWSDPIRINSDAYANNKRFFPWITCDPITHALSVIFYDNRNCNADQYAAWVANSYDGGVTWDDFMIGDYCFTPQGFSTVPSFFGDYLGISSYDGIVYPIWTSNHEADQLPRLYCSPYVQSPPDISPFVDAGTAGMKIHSGETKNTFVVTFSKLVEAAQESSRIFVVTDLNSNIVLREKIEGERSSIIDLTNNSAGIYLFKLFTGDKREVIKVLRE